MFRCDWVDVEKGKGLKRDPFGFTLVNLSKLVHTGVKSSDEPFVLASQVQQVFYVQDSLEPEWHMVVRTKARDVYDMGDDLSVASNIQLEFDQNETIEENQTECEEVSWTRKDIEGIHVDPKDVRDGLLSEDEW